MKKLNRRILEAQLRNMENQPTAEDMARMAEGEQLAYAEYLRRQAAEAQDAAAKRQKKKSRRLRTVVVCALAAAFLGLPLLYTMLMPVTVSNANSFMRQATIWINDTLHLNIKIEEPVQGDGRVYDTETVEMTFPSVADAEAYLGEKLLTLDCESTGLELARIEVTTYPEGIRLISMEYHRHAIPVILHLRDLQMLELLLPKEETEELKTAAGVIYIWSSEGVVRSIGSAGNWTVQLKTEMDISNARTIFSTLH